MSFITPPSSRYSFSSLAAIGLGIISTGCCCVFAVKRLNLHYEIGLWLARRQLVPNRVILNNLSQPTDSFWGRVVLMMMDRGIHEDDDRKGFRETFCKEIANQVGAIEQPASGTHRETPAKNVLEIGCANGLLLKLLINEARIKKPVYAVDMSTAALHEAITPPNGALAKYVAESRVKLQGQVLSTGRNALKQGRSDDDIVAELHVAQLGKPAPLGALPFGDSTLDFVVHTHCIYFWEDLKLGCREVYRVLKKQGGRHVFVMAPEALLKQFTQESARFINTTHEDVRVAGKETGFRIVEEREINGLTMMVWETR